MEDKISQRAEKIQQECHKTIEDFTKVSNRNISGLTYQDLTNVYLFRKIAELELKLEILLPHG